MSSSALTADHLFGPAAPAYSLLASIPTLEHAAGQANETRAAVALLAYALGRLIARWVIRPYELGVVVDLERELRATRAGLGELPQSDEEVVHLTRIARAVDVTAGDSEALGNQLLEYAVYLEQEGRLEEALQTVALAARAHGPRIAPEPFSRCALAAGRLNRLLARWDAAVTCYEAAEQTGRRHGDAVATLRGSLGRGAVARGRGNLPAARTIAGEVEAEAKQLGLVQVQATACADLAAAYSALGMPVEALQADYRAFELAQDPAQRMRTLGNVGTDLAQLGAYDAARIAFAIVVRSDAKAVIRLNALVELMGLAAATGDPAAFEHHRRTAQASRDQMPPSMVVDFLFKTAAGLDRFGKPAGARAALVEARAVAQSNALHAWEFRVEQALDAVGRATAQPAAGVATSLRDSPVVREVALGLQDYAAAAE